MTCDSGLCTIDQEWIETKMETPIHLNSKGNEIITWCLFDIGLCLLLSNHHRCMCCHCWCSLHHICVSRVNNDNVHQSMEAIFGNKNILLSSSVARQKVGDLLLNMCSTFQNNSCNRILKCVVGYYMLTPIRALKQMDT
jgi:hypothetical protein